MIFCIVMNDLMLVEDEDLSLTFTPFLNARVVQLSGIE